MMRLVTAAEMRAMDREVIDAIGVPGAVLMETAGRAVADRVARLADPRRLEVVVFAGAGNNGGDGFVAARHLGNWGAAVTVLLCADEAAIVGDARLHLEACRKSGVPLVPAWTAEGLAAALPVARAAGVAIDALLGTGLTRPVRGHLAAAIDALNGLNATRVSVDVPSGLDADRGVPLGACVRADHTVTFAFAKRGLVLAPGFTYVGALHVADIGIPSRLAEAQGVAASLLGRETLGPLLGRRAPLGHKGTHGHLLVIAGSRGKSGAALLAGRAGLRAGAGLVTLAAPEDLRDALDGRVPELMTAWYSPGAGASEVARAWQALLARRDAVAVGPGMPTDPALRPALGVLIEAVCAAGVGLVLDADALNHLADEPALLPPSLGARVVLTPHPGEAARLLGASTEEVQADRPHAALELARRFGAVAVLKGARTIVAAPGGGLAICAAGNPGLGSGGTGDVLTGCVGARLAAGAEAFPAACEAVEWHARAGDLIAAERGEWGILAGEVADALPRVLAGLATE